MGIFGPNEVSSIGDIQIEAAEGYSGSIGVQLALIESYQNQQALFNGVIENDFKETTMSKAVTESTGTPEEIQALEEEVQALQEGVMSTFLTKIREGFTKLLAKIKGIFTAFMAKLHSWLMKDGKAFCEKYKAQLHAKGDMSGLKYKYSTPKNPAFSFAIFGNSAMENRPCFSVVAIVEKEEIIEKFNRDTYITNVLKECSPKVSIESEKGYGKALHEACFDEEKEVSGVSNVDSIIAPLMGENIVANCKKANDSLEKSIKAIIADITKAEKYAKTSVSRGTDVKDVNSLTKTGISDNGKSNAYINPSGVSKENTAKYQKALAYMHTQGGALQTAAGAFTSGTLKETKFLVSQARRVAAAIVGYNARGKSVSKEEPKEEIKKEALDMLLQVEQEAAEYEVMSALEAI